jgi:hypothetical protein
MPVRFHPHARERIAERGATEAEVVLTVETGETFAAKLGRTGFRRNPPSGGEWKGRRHAAKQIEAYAVEEDGDWLVITVLVRFLWHRGGSTGP